MPERLQELTKYSIDNQGFSPQNPEAIPPLEQRLSNFATEFGNLTPFLKTRLIQHDLKGNEAYASLWSIATSVGYPDSDTQEKDFIVQETGSEKQEQGVEVEESDEGKLVDIVGYLNETVKRSNQLLEYYDEHFEEIASTPWLNVREELPHYQELLPMLLLHTQFVATATQEQTPENKQLLQEQYDKLTNQRIALKELAFITNCTIDDISGEITVPWMDAMIILNAGNNGYKHSVDHNASISFANSTVVVENVSERPFSSEWLKAGEKEGRLAGSGLGGFLMAQLSYVQGRVQPYSSTPIENTGNHKITATIPIAA